MVIVAIIIVVALIAMRRCAEGKLSFTVCKMLGTMEKGLNGLEDAAKGLAKVGTDIKKAGAATGHLFSDTVGDATAASYTHLTRPTKSRL